MLVTMAIGLYTSRVVLNLLGSADFGVYNLIAGVIVLFSFINNSMTTATQRNLNYYVGLKDFDSAKKFFCMSTNSYVIVALVFIFFAETVGLWFVKNKLNIPLDRMNSACMVFHISVFNFVVSLLRIPYNAAIIAYERMTFYAYVSLAEAFLKLFVVYLLAIFDVDRLILYALLYCFVSVIINVIYRTYSRKKFSITRYSFFWDFSVFKKIFSFFGWSLLGSVGNVVAQHGINILINIFFGVIANAAVGIANQVSSVIYSFVSNFQTAFQPRIVTYYAENKIEYMHALVFQSSKFSFFLMMLIAFPFVLALQTILGLWLVEVPENTAVFCRLIIGFYIIDAVAAPLWMEIYATGNIKTYQIFSSALVLMNFPLTYLCFKLTMPVYVAWIVRIFINGLIFVVRCFYMKRVLSFPLWEYTKQVLCPICMVVVCSAPIPIVMKALLPHTVFWDASVFFVAFAFSVLFIILIGLNKEEREMVFALPKIMKKRFEGK